LKSGSDLRQSRRRPITGCAALSALLLLVCSGAMAQLDPEIGPAGEPHRVPYVSGPVRIDAVLDEEAWSQALVIELGYETFPRENAPAPVATTAYIMQDGERLLVAFDARDPDPSAIRAYLRDRDSAFADDFVGIVIDTFGDQQRAFELFVNPLGVQMDLTYDEVNQNESTAWDAIWESAGRITADGFIVEMAIPFSQLRFQRTEGEQVWGFDVLRFYPRENRVRMSNNRQERGRNCYLCQLARMQGFESARPGRGLEVVPSLTATRFDERVAGVEGPLVKGDPETELGLNVRWAITPDLTASLAINPDFSQVEADVPQLEINNQFALFFPEKRPFFLESADYFSTPINAVFTRTMADPDVGLKLTGRTEGHTFGVFAVEDATTNLLFPGALGSRTEVLDQSNRAGVGRYTWTSGQGSTVGALLTMREGAGYRNQVAGVDGRARISDRHNVRFQFLSSDTLYPAEIAERFGQPEERFSGNAWRVNYSYSSRNWFGFIGHHAAERGFRADSGFLPRVDIQQVNAEGGRVWHGSSSNWWNQMRLGTFVSRTRDQEGQLLERRAQAFFAMQGPRQSFVQLGRGVREQFWNGELYDADNWFVFGQVRPVGNLSFSMAVNGGEQIDFANSRLGKQLSFEPNVEWNVNRHLFLRLRHTTSELQTRSGETIFDADLTDLRLTWQFNLRSFVRLTAQRQHIRRNGAVFLSDVDERTETIGHQLLYSYKLNPQTVVFVGHADRHLDNGTLLGRTRLDRTLFVKLSYAWIP
jgi:hypothetical protein